MSQSAIFDDAIFGNAALQPVDPFAPVREPVVDPAIFERLPITPAEPVGVPRLRLVVDGDGEGSHGPVHSATGPGRPAPVRLTRRGRIVGVVVLALIDTAISFALSLATSQASMAPAAGAISPAAGTSVVVQPGETLWSIATAVAPNADPRATVDALIAANHLQGGAIQAGQVLVLP
jgi:hypothetical protein